MTGIFVEVIPKGTGLHLRSITDASYQKRINNLPKSMLVTYRCYIEIAHIGVTN